MAIKKNITKEIAELIKEKNKFMKEEKLLKIKLKEKENELINLKYIFKKENKNNYMFSGLMICKENSIIYLSTKLNIEFKNYNKVLKQYNKISEERNYNNFLREKEKGKERRKVKCNNSIHNKSNSVNNSNIRKHTTVNISSNSNNNNNNSTKNIINKNKNNNYYDYVKKNIANIIDFIHDQNDINSPSNFIKIDSTFFKKEKNQSKSKSKETSPSSHNKFKYSTINNNSNRNNSQVMINVNTNIINSNGSIEKFKFFKKIFDRKLNEMTRNIIPNTLKRTISAFQNRRHSSPNFYDNHRQREYSTINKNFSKNSSTNIKNLKKKKKLSPHKNRQLNSTNKNYSNISVHSSRKKSINNFRKKTPHRVVTQRKEISPNLKINHYLYSSSNSNTKQQSKDNLKNSKNSSNHIRIIEKNSISHNTSNIFANNSNYNTNHLIKNHSKIDNLLNSHQNNNYNNFKKLNNYNIIEGILNNGGLIVSNSKSRSGISTINNNLSNHSSLRNFKYSSSNSGKQSK